MTADDLVGFPARDPLHRFRHEREGPVGIGREDDVRGVLDQEPVALLRFAQLALEPFLLGDVADRALDAGEPAVLPDRDRGDLAGKGRPVAIAQHVVEAPDDVVLVALLGEVGERLRERLLGGQVGEGQIRDLGRRPAEQGLGALGHEQEPAVRVAPVDDVGRGLDEIAEARLGGLQVVLETLPFGDIAGDAVDRRQPAVLEVPDHVDLERHRRPAVAALEVEPRRVEGARVRDELGELLERALDPAVGDDLAEMAADGVLDVPAQHRSRPVAQERPVPLGVGREDEVRRRRGERPVADLRVAQAGQQGRVGDGDGGLVGEALQEVELLGVEAARRARRDRERPDDLAARGAQWRGGHPAQPEAHRDLVVVALVRDPRDRPRSRSSRWVCRAGLPDR